MTKIILAYELLEESVSKVFPSKMACSHNFPFLVISFLSQVIKAWGMARVLLDAQDVKIPVQFERGFFEKTAILSITNQVDIGSSCEISCRKYV